MSHVLHMRSLVGVPATDCPAPSVAEQVCHAVHVLSPDVALKLPDAHAAQTRSLDTVAAAEICWPAGQGARTAVHAAPSSAAENVEPTAHAAHTRSADAVPSVLLPSPAGQVRHAVQLLSPAVAVKVPDAHAEHTRSLDAVAAAAVRSPAAQGARTAAHLASLLTAENVDPALHTAHARSAVAVPSVSSPCPAGHSDHGVHAAALPAALLNWPAVHAVHTRSEDGPGAALSNMPAAHVVVARHTRSACVVGAANVYCPAGQPGMCVAHARLDVSVAAVVSHSSVGSHTSAALHAAPLSLAENVEPSTHGAQTRSEEAVPATDWPSPAGHVAHGAHVLSPALAVKDSAAQAAHTRSLDTVAAVAVCSPAAHGARTALHAAAPSLAENVEPATQAPHTRSVLSLPSTVLPSPAGHVRHAAQLVLPATLVNVPGAQAAQTRSADAVAAEVVC